MMIDEFLTQSGSFGPAQWMLLSLFSLVNVLSSFHYFAQTFINLAPRYICDLKNCTFANETLNELSETVNDTSGEMTSCEDILEALSSGWTFQTLSTELNWVCDEGWKAATVQSFFFVGSVVGTLVLGILADVVGRLPMMAIANLLAVFGNLLTVYVPPTMLYLGVSRFVAGLATDTNFFMMYIIVMEYIKPSLRTVGLNLSIGVWYCVGCMVTPWVAVYCRYWRNFLLAVSFATLSVPLLCFTVPESAQWLVSRGRVDDAIKCFKKVASLNRRKISQEFISQFKATSANSTKQTKQGSLTGLFVTPNLRRKFCILIFKTMVLTLCYDAMSRNIEGLGVDPFSMFTITSATIFPSCVVILLFQDRIGRKAVAVVSLLFTGLFNFGQGIILTFCKDLTYAGAIVGMCGRLAINIAYNSGTQYAAELIPTQIRGQGLATIHVVGYAAAFFSPHILYLSSKWVATPEVVLGILAVLGAVFCLFLPETLHQSLPVTLEDGEKFGEGEHFWDFVKPKKDKKDDMEKSNTDL